MFVFNFLTHFKLQIHGYTSNQRNMPHKYIYVLSELTRESVKNRIYLSYVLGVQRIMHDCIIGKRNALATYSSYLHIASTGADIDIQSFHHPIPSIVITCICFAAWSIASYLFCKQIFHYSLITMEGNKDKPSGKSALLAFYPRLASWK